MLAPVRTEGFAHEIAPPVEPTQPGPGETVLGVMLAAPIGSGNAARVWSGLAGEDPVAVKIFDPALRGDEASRAAFARGATAMACLSAGGTPPWILRTLRHAPDGLVLVTDIAESDVNDLVALDWPPHKIVPFFTQVCQAIAAAHGLGVMHRCLKPGNILVSDELTPLVADFDLVDLPALGRESSDAGGYGPYAAPEALSGEAAPAPTADVYSLGRVLYFLLLGRDPDEPASDLPALFPLAGRPQGLLRIIRKCTMRDPAARYQDVDALLADLGRWERADEVGIAGPVFEAAPASSRRFDMLDAPPASVRGGARGSLEDSGPVSVRGPASSRGAALSARASSPGLDEAAPASQRAPLSRRGEAAPASRREGLSSPAILDSTSALWLPRRAEQIAAASGAGIWVALAAAVMLSPLPSAGLLVAVQYGAAAGAALLTLALPRFSSRLISARVAFAALAFVLVHLADASELTSVRLRATLGSADGSARGEAARQLARRGHRDLSGVDLSGVDLSGAELSNVLLGGASLSRANLSGATLMEAEFNGADLSEATAGGADLSGSNAEVATGWATVICDGFTRMPAGWACVEGRPGREEGESAEAGEP